MALRYHSCCSAADRVLAISGVIFEVMPATLRARSHHERKTN
jgi:hypothetical protein